MPSYIGCLEFFDGCRREVCREGNEAAARRKVIAFRDRLVRNAGGTPDGRCYNTNTVVEASN